ncbi:MAG: glycosyltransferase family 2 protein [Bacteroidota bacterium]
MVQSKPSVSIIVPANNEAGYIEQCLNSLLNQDETCSYVEVIVSANACTDGTEERARAFGLRFQERGWELKIISNPEPGKIGAIRRGEAVAKAETMVYIDADVTCDAELIGQLAKSLDTSRARYASGTFTLMPAQSLISRIYGKFWVELPFLSSSAVGIGLYAVNKAGRSRWGAFPEIISDDTFVRLTFKQEERIQVSARYYWPLAEGFFRLVRVRIRQNKGVSELKSIYPNIFENENKTDKSVIKLIIRRPLAFCVYAAVQISVSFSSKDVNWNRGR